jgi:hypothetical protein
MHELLFYGATAFGGSLSLWAARLRWLRHRRTGAPRVGERIAPWSPMPTTDDGTLDRNQLRANQATVFVFMSNRCPGVKAYDARLRLLAERFGPRHVQFVGVNSIDASHYPGEDLEAMAAAAQERGFTFPYVKDTHQEFAMSMGAFCTPQVFVVDASWRLRYRGRIDDALVESRARRPYLANALDQVLAGQPVADPETAPLGCSIEFSQRVPAKGRRGLLGAARSLRKSRRSAS